MKYLSEVEMPVLCAKEECRRICWASLCKICLINMHRWDYFKLKLYCNKLLYLEYFLIWGRETRATAQWTSTFLAHV